MRQAHVPGHRAAGHGSRRMVGRQGEGQADIRSGTLRWVSAQATVVPVCPALGSLCYTWSTAVPKQRPPLRCSVGRSVVHSAASLPGTCPSLLSSRGRFIVSHPRKGKGDDRTVTYGEREARRRWGGDHIHRTSLVVYCQNCSIS